MSFRKRCNSVEFNDRNLSKLRGLVQRDLISKYFIRFIGPVYWVPVLTAHMGKGQTPVTESLKSGTGISNPDVTENSAHRACKPEPYISNGSNVTDLVQVPAFDSIPKVHDSEDPLIRFGPVRVRVRIAYVRNSGPSE